MNIHRSIALVAVSCAAALLLAGCSSSVDLASHWVAPAAGGTPPPNTAITYIDKQNVGVGIQNDSANVYLTLVTSSRTTMMKLVRFGLTVRVAPKGSEGTTVAVHYPLGLQSRGDGGFMRNEEGGQRGEERGDPRGEERTAEALIAAAPVREMLERIELVGDKDQLREAGTVESFRGYGIMPEIRDTLGVLSYRLKVPLRLNDTTGHALQLAPGGRFTLAVASGTPRQQEGGGRMGTGRIFGGGGGGGMGGGGMGGGGRGGGRGMGGGREGMQEMMEPLEVNAVVTLAKAPAAPPATAAPGTPVTGTSHQ